MTKLKYIICSFFLFVTINIMAQDGSELFLTQYLLRRVLFVKSDIGTGSSFVIEKNNRSFLVTAKHIFPNLKENDSIKFQVTQNKKWVELSGIAHLSSNKNADVIIIDLQSELFEDNTENYLETKGYIPLGAEGYFLGFPMSFKTEIEDNYGLPIPLVKKVIFSGSMEVDGVIIKFLDGNNTKGFSGGPVFIKSYSKGKVNWFFFGIISGYYYQNNVTKTNQGDLNYNENSGIIKCIGISYIKEIMDKIK